MYFLLKNKDGLYVQEIKRETFLNVEGNTKNVIIQTTLTHSMKYACTFDERTAEAHLRDGTYTKVNLEYVDFNKVRNQYVTSFCSVGNREIQFSYSSLESEAMIFKNYGNIEKFADLANQMGSLGNVHEIKFLGELIGGNI